MQGSHASPPRRILLATTDLSGRGDRAMDRATQLAKVWNSELHIVHAVDQLASSHAEQNGTPSWERKDTAADIEESIRDDIRGAPSNLYIHVEEGDPLKVILDSASRLQCELIVVGLGRDRAFSASTVSKITQELVRRAPVSVLVVKRRPNEPYGHVIVGTDFTPESKEGLEVAAALFPAATLVVMHSFEMPYRQLMQNTQLGRDFGAMEQATMKTFVEGARLAPDVRARLITLVEHGRAELMLTRYVTDQRADLTVIGAYERNILFHMIVGGNGQRIVDIVPNDVLVVRPSS